MVIYTSKELLAIVPEKPTMAPICLLAPARSLPMISLTFLRQNLVFGVIAVVMLPGPLAAGPNLPSPAVGLFFKAADLPALRAKVGRPPWSSTAS